VVSVITHHHRDHFAASLFLPNRSWQLVGPPSVTASIPPGRVLLGDSLSVGAFSIIALPTPHTPDHRSYRIRWHDRILHFAGDTEEAASVLSATRLDVLFVTPWLQCALDRERRTVRWDRAILYHLQVGGGDRICGTTEALAQGASFTLSPRRVPPPP
jgi:glyoxylase-like metal-dependent hydrolase (beta-lactamase superfamily II)